MIDAKAVKEIATKYIYDKCPAIAAIGESTLVHFLLSKQLSLSVYSGMISKIFLFATQIP